MDDTFGFPTSIPPRSRQKKFLEFEGVRQAAELWLNGKYLGAHANASNLTEVADQANASTGANRVVAKSLSIIEAECYEPLPAR